MCSGTTVAWDGLMTSAKSSVEVKDGAGDVAPKMQSYCGSLALMWLASGHLTQE